MSIELGALKATRNQIEVDMNNYLDMFDITTSTSMHGFAKREILLTKLTKCRVKLDVVDQKIDELTANQPQAVHLMSFA